MIKITLSDKASIDLYDAKINDKGNKCFMVRVIHETHTENKYIPIAWFEKNLPSDDIDEMWTALHINNREKLAFFRLKYA